MMQQPYTWSSCAISHVGNVRKMNEDAYLERPDLGLWVVADGMGGHAAGDVASKLIVSTLDQLDPQDNLSRFTDAVEDTLLAVNRELVASAAISHQTSGSTVVALLLHGRHCVYLWAGDSRAYMLRKGVLEQLTVDHSQVELYVKLGLISREEASTHPSSNMVTRAIGADDQLCLDLDMLEAYAGDRYLLCSDGLHKHLSNNDIAQVLVSGSTANVARALIDMTLARGATDNVTVVVIDIFDQTDKTAASADLETTVPGASVTS